MIRPCFLMLDRDFAGALSTRKLVVETAKLNVLTAYSGEEAVATLQRFPAVSGVILDAGVTDRSCAEIVCELKEIQPSVPIIVIGTPSHSHCDGADHFLDSFEPAKLLGLLSRLLPDVAAIREGEETSQHDGQ